MADKLAQSQALLRELSTHDSLTGLLNHREPYGNSRTRRSVPAPGRPFSLAMLDIDHFKAVNDTYGHLAGDKALRALAALIRQEVRPTDVRGLARRRGICLGAARDGGPGCHDAGRALAGSCRRPRRGRGRPHHIRDGEHRDCSASRRCQCRAEAAERAADQALYAAKSAGRNRVWPVGRSMTRRTRGRARQREGSAVVVTTG
ncbi:MAG: GGDEF domain-containing protein [Rhodopseudomonas palustris]|nr:GGDEF domain-containing protein [Rhodopseudomonas palustris]